MKKPEAIPIRALTLGATNGMGRSATTMSWVLAPRRRLVFSQKVSVRMAVWTWWETPGSGLHLPENSIRITLTMGVRAYVTAGVRECREAGRGIRSFLCPLCLP
jgi:hypothetical protein